MANDNDKKPSGKQDRSSEFNDGRKSITITANVESGSVFPIKPGESQGSGSASTGKSEGDSTSSQPASSDSE